MKKALITIALLATTSVASSQIIMAPKNTGCGNWLELAQAEPAHEYFNMRWFIIGFYGGQMQAYRKDVRAQDAETITAYMTTFCRNNPLSNVIAGTKALVEESGGPKTTFQWKR